MLLNQSLDKLKQGKIDREIKKEMNQACSIAMPKQAHGLQIEAKVRWSQGPFCLQRTES
jgi:hypothetical protein